MPDAQEQDAVPQAWQDPVAATDARDDLFVGAYDELRRLAGAILRSDPSATLSATALVNEAWLKLAASAPLSAESSLHLRRIAGRAMRQVLVEAARRRQAGKRGGGQAMVTFDESLDASLQVAADDVVALDDALAELAALNPRQSAMIECRFFAGLDVLETAAHLGVSEATVMRDWRAARAWLIDVLQHG